MAHKYKQLTLDWVKKNFPRIPETKGLFDAIPDFDKFLDGAAAAITKNQVDQSLVTESNAQGKALEPVLKKLRATKWTDPKHKNIPALLEELSNTHKVFVRELTGAFDAKSKSDEGATSKLLTQNTLFTNEIVAAQKGSDIMKTKLDAIELAIAEIKKVQGIVFKENDWMTRWRSIKNEYEKTLLQLDAKQKATVKKRFDELATSLAKQVSTSQELKKRVEKLLPK
jgi:hypothetical protein